MNKLIASTALALSLFAAPLAFAQPYYGTCVSIPAGLSVGSRGTDVSTLQNFLVAQNYPGGGSWMETGYFGEATAAAVRNFQSLHGLAQTGSVDAATASAMSGSCLTGQSVGTVPVYSAPTYYPSTYAPISTTYPSYYSYPSYLSYYGGTPTITSLSQNTGTSGAVLTIYGVGFDQWNNTVNFGGTAVPNVPSQNGTSLTFVVPSNYYAYSFAGTAIQLTVSNGHGTSNAVSFTVWGTPSTCGLYGYSNCGGCLPTGQAGNNYYAYPYNYNYGYNYNYNYNGYCPQPNNPGVPTISYLNPTSGGVGTIVAAYGSGFSANGNTVHFGSGIITNLNSVDGHGLSFTVPSTLTGYGTQPITLSTYQVSVTNNLGYTSNALPFVVTSILGGGAPTITSVNGPTSLNVGNQGLWTVLVNTMNSSYLTLSVNWGDQNVYGNPTNQPLYASGQQTNTFTHTYYQSGTYTVVFTVSNNQGQQNSYTTTVVVGGNTQGNVSLSYLSPQSGVVGTQIIIQGAGFTPYDNTVHFGAGGLAHVMSQNGGVIYYTIPSYVSPCDLTGSGCGASVQQVIPGSYPISITNGNGSSNALMFQVQ